MKEPEYIYVSPEALSIIAQLKKPINIVFYAMMKKATKKNTILFKPKDKVNLFSYIPFDNKLKRVNDSINQLIELKLLKEVKQNYYELNTIYIKKS